MMKPLSKLKNWRDLAVCAEDKNSSRWLSYDIEDVQYAKEGCAKCTVRRECLATALQNDCFVGVVAGISEYEYLNIIWNEVAKEDESNWRRDNTALSELLQKAQ